MPGSLKSHSITVNITSQLRFGEESAVELKPLDVESPTLPDEPSTSVPSRCSLEYLVYALYMMGFIIYGFSVVSEVSTKYAPWFYLSKPRWTLLTLAPFHSVGYNGSGDGQWKALDGWLWLLVLLFLALAMGSKLIRWSFRGRNEVVALQYFHVFVGLIFVAFLHGPSFYLPIVFTLINYVFALRCIRYHLSYRVFMTLMWTFQVGLLLSISYTGGYARFFFVPGPKTWWSQRFRWSVVFNMYTLRMIAFNMDMYEAFHDGAALQEKAVQKHDAVCVECAQMRESNPNRGEGTHTARCYKFRTEYPCQLRDYNLLSYMTYILYVPLYIAGPMSSFNAFVSHLHYPTTVMTRKQMLFYAFRVLLIYVVLIVLLHFAFVNAFRTYPKFLAKLSISQLAYLLYYSLAFLWLKFSLVWKLSRLAAILNGVDVPEDMRRCFSNTVSVRDFWRDWHASFNLWIVRYMYIPMGGNKKKHLNIFPIFFFIAIWHDIELHLLYWASCIIFIFVLELLAGYVWNLPFFSRLHHFRYQRLLRSFGGAFSVFGLIVANLIGFSQTRSGSVGQTDHLITSGLYAADPNFYLFSFLTFFCAAAMGIIERDIEAVELLRLKKKYKLN
ncbi:glycerol uptake protein [Trypanosoma theileri]|uniref:Glycerol uptake protein n=1 Tax=Trypanosoma theileri TaxID=67003 RepID=A0A1X0P616_9TRYP|nr:glycerol uptake protein [Trypanosoma theileri]ORC92377.1 glycerol uptake protein [Trypanosoma theileri]